MKKTLLALTALLGFAGSAMAADIVEDWTQAGSWMPNTWEATNTTPAKATSTATNIEYEVLSTTVNTQYTPNYLFIQGKVVKSPKAYISFSLPIDCAEIIVSTTNYNSTNTSNKINVYAGDATEPFIKQQLVNTHKTDIRLTIPTDLRAAGTVYKIETNTTSYNQQFYKFTYVEVTSDPKLSVDKNSIAFATPLNATQEQTIKITTENITDNISLSVNNAAFTVPASVSVEEAAKGVTVTYTGDAAGNIEAVLTVSVGNLKQEVTLNAKTVAHAGTEEDPLTVADVIALGSVNKGPFYVTGTIGDKCAANAKNGVIQETTTLAASNIILKDAEGNMIPVALASKTDARTTLNIQDNPNNVGQTVIIKGSLEDYFGAPGVKSTEYVSGLSGTVGIDSIGVDANNAPVEYYNLQGQRVANPENGLFIRRQGNTVTKVIIR